MHTSPLSHSQSGPVPARPGGSSRRVANGEPTPIQTGTVPPSGSSPGSTPTPIHPAAGTGSRDRVSVSGEGRMRARAEAAASETSAERATQVESIRVDVESGTYAVDPTAIARAMLRQSEG